MKKNIIFIYFIITCLLLSSCDNTNKNTDSTETEVTPIATTSVSTEMPQEDEYINILVHSYSLEEVGLKLSIPDDKVPKSPYLNDNTTSELCNEYYYSILEQPHNQIENGSTKISVNIYIEGFGVNQIYVAEYAAFKYSDFYFPEGSKQQKELGRKKLYRIPGRFMNSEDVFLSGDELKNYFKVYSDGDIFVCNLSKFSETFYNGTIPNANVYDGYDIRDYMEYEKKRIQREDMDFQWLYDFVDYLHENISDIIVKA